MPVAPERGQTAYLTTYGSLLIGELDSAFSVDDAEGACRHVVAGSVFAGFEHPVCATAAVMAGMRFEVATARA